jgi:hypothetical protein
LIPWVLRRGLTGIFDNHIGLRAVCTQINWTPHLYQKRYLRH